MNGSVAVRIEGLTVRFGGVTSLAEVDLAFPVGACGLIGPNGAGKTTLFNVLSGFAKPAEGRVVAFGDDIGRLPAHHRARWGIRRTFQTEQAIESLSLEDNVRMVLEHTGGRRRGSVDEAIEFVGLAGRGRDRVGSLNAGERRFVELARAVVGAPRLILLDEPAAGLPAESTEAVARIIRRMSAELGATTILVDHDMALVSECCEWTAVLDFGRVIASGATAEVLVAPEVTTAYLGEVAS